jgi:hypothetical protein
MVHDKRSKQKPVFRKIVKTIIKTLKGDKVSRDSIL